MARHMLNVSKVRTFYFGVYVNSRNQQSLEAEHKSPIIVDLNDLNWKVYRVAVDAESEDDARWMLEATGYDIHSYLGSEWLPKKDNANN